MTSYDSLGVDTIVNAATTYTALGGSLMPEEVLHAMRDAAGSFVDMHELHLAAGKRIATLTNNEAAYVTSGCAAALVLAILGIRTGGNPAAITEFPGRSEVPHEVVMHAAHRIPYDSAVALAGGTIRQIGNVLQTFSWELEQAITEKTAAVLYVAGSHLPQTALPLEDVVAIAHVRGIPVIVDAAAQLPPVENLWHYTREVGADIAVFSGGKALRGPQASGFMVGNADRIEAARQNGSPYQRWARALKAGKEEVVGLVTAIERFVSIDHDAERAIWLRTVEGWRDALAGSAGVVVSIDPYNEAGQPVPRLHLSVRDQTRSDAILAHLDAGSPRIAVVPDVTLGRSRGLWIGPDMLRAGEADIVQRAVLDAIARAERTRK